MNSCVPPGVTFFVTKESNQRKSCEIESPEGRPGKAGPGLRDFDGTDYTLKEASKSQILFARPHLNFVSISRTIFDRAAGVNKGKHRNHETCLYPPRAAVLQGDGGQVGGPNSEFRVRNSELRAFLTGHGIQSFPHETWVSMELF